MALHNILVATNKSVRRYASSEHSHEKLIILFNTLSLASSKDETYSQNIVVFPCGGKWE